MDELRELGVRLVLGPNYLEQLDAPWDAVFLTPGMRKDVPVLNALRSRGVPFYSEIGLFFSLCRAPIIGITGSSGKTTTTSLIGDILKTGDRPVYVGGNIGTPLVETAESIPEKAWVVLELSSFQLEMLDESPQVAVVTNITPNHLDLHGTMEAYIDAERRIYQFQRSSDVSVFNADDVTTRAMMEQAPGRRLAFSRREAPLARAWLDDDRIVLGSPSGSDIATTTICRLDELQLLGDHNVENVLAAVVVADACGMHPDKIRSVVVNFTGSASPAGTGGPIPGCTFLQ